MRHDRRCTCSWACRCCACACSARERPSPRAASARCCASCPACAATSASRPPRSAASLRARCLCMGLGEQTRHGRRFSSAAPTPSPQGQPSRLPAGKQQDMHSIKVQSRDFQGVASMQHAPASTRRWVPTSSAVPHSVAPLAEQPPCARLPPPAAAAAARSRGCLHAQLPAPLQQLPPPAPRSAMFTCVGCDAVWQNASSSFEAVPRASTWLPQVCRAVISKSPLSLEHNSPAPSDL